MPKIAYVTTYDARNVNHWSGIGYYIAKAFMDKAMTVEFIGPLTKYVSLNFKLKEMIGGVIFDKRYISDREPIILEHYAQQVAEKLTRINPDIVFSPGTIPISHLECRQPVVFWADATFAGMLDFYPAFSNLSKHTIANGNKMEQSALSRCSLAIYASDWAAETAIENYQVTASKVKVVPFGANIECNRNLEDVKDIVLARPHDRCKLLFIGVDWYRKGGDIALNVAKELNDQGLKTELHVVGCEPEIGEPVPEFLASHGFLSKSHREGRDRINRLLAESHFLILPSRAECFGIVFCEASSFGVPSLATNVGGIPTAVKEGFNGKTFSIDTSVQDYCTYISYLMSDYSRYQQLALSSFGEYETRLNWNASCAKVKELLIEFCT